MLHAGQEHAQQWGGGCAYASQGGGAGQGATVPVLRWREDVRRRHRLAHPPCPGERRLLHFSHRQSDWKAGSCCAEAAPRPAERRLLAGCGSVG